MSNLSKALNQLNNTVMRAVKHAKPPENIVVSEWADKYRQLSPEISAEAGTWRTSRTPYLKDPMDALTDPKVKRIVMVACSQVGKSELELNMIGYIMDQDPGSILFVQPTLDEARKFSKTRIAPMIRDCSRLRGKVSDVKSRDSSNTMLQKSFAGGMLTIAGSNSAPALASTPVRYVLGDERDRWALSAGTEGDPWSLAEARTTTFYNAKMVEVSTPTIKGASNIEASFAKGTQERWCHLCPECGEWHNIVFDHIKFEFDTVKVKGRKTFEVKWVKWACPSCGCMATEEVMRKQPAKWIAENPKAYDNGVKSYWLNSFSSPWLPWTKIVHRFLDAKDDPEKLKVVYNTVFGELWEDRGDVEEPEVLMNRREEYPAELPSEVLVLTCGVDTQGDRLEYEVKGYGHYGESWGIKRGMIVGDPADKETWAKLDDIIDHVYKYPDGRGLKISLTCVDSGGNKTQEVYEACRQRFNKKVFAIKGKGGDGIPFISPATKVPIRDSRKVTCWLYTIGVDSGKQVIMDNLKVQEQGPKYCHFPLGDERGYDFNYFNGLLSEKLVLKREKGRDRWAWVKLPGHQRNEALDCANYANAALRIINPVMDEVERKRRESLEAPKKAPTEQVKPIRKRTSNSMDYMNDW